MTTSTIRSPTAGPAAPRDLSIPRGAALYIGALLGPGLLLLPGLAAAQAGPASVLAWLALLIMSALIAAVFAALGKARPSAGGVIGYAAAGLGPRAGTAVGWCFLAGVICGAPIVCLIGANYVTDLTGGGQAVRCAVAAALMLVVLGLALGGVRASVTVQLVLVALLIGAVVLAVAGSAPSARGGNWAPFAPHGWTAIGRAASTLMLSFVGWEAVAPLTTRFAEPARQLPRVIAIAFAVTTAIYLGLAVATVAVLGTGAGTDVPLAALLRHAIGPAGRAAAAVLAVVLTLGAVNAYLAGATAMARELAARPAGQRTPRGFLALIALAGLLVIGLYAVHLVTAAALVTLPATLFLAVYLGCMASAVRMLRGGARRAAVPAMIAVAAVLSFCGWALAVTAIVAGTAAVRDRNRVPRLGRSSRLIACAQAAGPGRQHVHQVAPGRRVDAAGPPCRARLAERAPSGQAAEALPQRVLRKSFAGTPTAGAAGRVSLPRAPSGRRPLTARGARTQTRSNLISAVAREGMWTSVTMSRGGTCTLSASC